MDISNLKLVIDCYREFNEMTVPCALNELIYGKQCFNIDMDICKECRMFKEGCKKEVMLWGWK